ncbi:MBL fold metallo-hydrolase [Acidaminobacter hydrogenoformans]|uniref:7,8-dihydropterin-6-yl-methyl-4-(Beta-D-ribofuranosyl)aminobenzene 5'-phosphate synthase n=1 Tax=Acidaminobacter hydrogenoformans DSM 2784 TaxID=1120920 RepID=A0A1G5RUV1_9FIRM|nr:MBL fold metallo-hydrolase [Acidaminobacter hydrogenoformans]SCZ77231.1 7,8-dihydropterin-6-yl-methyl-4-(beta-D-ribofuranosyl)aminobenzene 5'-phosphate synthase [Acidaminobacter hydrogenoformans DSM 2784]
MKLTLLVDNQTLVDRYFLAEPAFSAWIESGEVKLLFDTGYSEVFLENARRLKLEISEMDVLVLSHGHSDHTWGLPALAAHLRQNRRREDRVKLVAHPDVFEEKGMDGEIYGVDFNISDFEDIFECQLSKTPVDLGGGLTYLGEIPRVNDFEAKKSIGLRRVDGNWLEDFILDDSAISYLGTAGLVVISGCSHSGIVNIVRHAMTLSGTDQVVDILGGFHLQKPTFEQLEGTAVFLEGLGLKQLHASHCTDLPSKCRLMRTLPLKEIGSGSVLEYR